VNVFSSAAATDSLEKETGAGKDEVEPAPKKVHEEHRKNNKNNSLFSS